MTINVPIQVALARQNLDCVVVGGVDSTICLYDRATSELVHSLGHKVKGHIQVVDVSTNVLTYLCAVANKYWVASTPETELIAVGSSSLGQKSIIQLWHLKGSPKSSSVSLFFILYLL